jgi:hypothetical protein
MLCKIALRSSEDFVVMGSLKYLAPINVALSIEDMAVVLLHKTSWLCFVRRNI